MRFYCKSDSSRKLQDVLREFCRSDGVQRFHQDSVSKIADENSIQNIKYKFDYI